VSIMKEKKEKRKYRRYDESFKKNAVKMLETGRSIGDVSSSLGISHQSLYEWEKKYGSKAQTSPELESKLKHLEKKLREVEQERDILKKALSIFSRQT